MIGHPRAGSAARSLSQTCSATQAVFFESPKRRAVMLADTSCRDACAQRYWDHRCRSRYCMHLLAL